MTNEEAVNELIRAFNVLDHSCHMDNRRKEAFNKAYVALKAEPCEDAVSLDGVIDTIEWYRTNPQHFTEDNLIEDIKGLPLVTPKPTECED